MSDSYGMSLRGRITEALLTLLRPNWDAEIRRAQADYQEMTLEVASLIDKLNTWAAREAKRQSRDAKKHLEGFTVQGQQMTVDEGGRVQPEMSYKDQLRKRVYSQMRGTRREHDLPEGQATG